MNDSGAGVNEDENHQHIRQQFMDFLHRMRKVSVFDPGRSDLADSKQGQGLPLAESGYDAHDGNGSEERVKSKMRELYRSIRPRRRRRFDRGRRRVDRAPGEASNQQDHDQLPCRNVNEIRGRAQVSLGNIVAYRAENPCAKHEKGGTPVKGHGCRAIGSGRIANLH